MWWCTRAVNGHLQVYRCGARGRSVGSARVRSKKAGGELVSSACVRACVRVMVIATRARTDCAAWAGTESWVCIRCACELWRGARLWPL